MAALPPRASRPNSKQQAVGSSLSAVTCRQRVVGADADKLMEEPW